MGFFHLVQQDDRVGLAPYLFGQLPAFLVTHVPGRGTYQARYREFFHVLAHVDPDQGILGVEEFLCQDLGELRLPDAGLAQEYKTSDRFVRVFEAGPVPLDGLGDLGDRLVLPDHAVLDQLGQLGQFVAFGLGDFIDRDAAHHGDHVRDVILSDGFPVHFTVFLPFFLCGGQVLFQAFFIVPKFGSLLVTLFLDHAVLEFPDFFQLFFQFEDLFGDIHVHDMHP